MPKVIQLVRKEAITLTSGAVIKLVHLVHNTLKWSNYKLLVGVCASISLGIRITREFLKIKILEFPFITIDQKSGMWSQ